VSATHKEHNGKLTQFSGFTVAAKAD